MYPIRFEPIYQSYVWGGDRISKRFYRKQLPIPCAESWEIADRPEGMSIVANGVSKGQTLNELVLEWGERLLGQGRTLSRFPLLIKIIDAKENLSIQVHPDDLAATLLHGEPKSESWIFLHDGLIYAGLKRGAMPENLRSAIENGIVEALVEKIAVKAGDVVYIPAGSVHAICAGCLLLEIQQNSNTTYRLYDWGRTERDLHIDQALASIHWQHDTSPKVKPRPMETDSRHTMESLIRCPYFSVDRFQILDRWSIPINPNTFQILFCVQREAEIEVDGHTEPFKPGMTYLVPACAHSLTISGACQMIRIWCPR